MPYSSSKFSFYDIILFRLSYMNLDMDIDIYKMKVVSSFRGHSWNAIRFNYIVGIMSLENFLVELKWFLGEDFYRYGGFLEGCMYV